MNIPCCKYENDCCILNDVMENGLQLILYHERANEFLHNERTQFFELKTNAKPFVSFEMGQNICNLTGMDIVALLTHNMTLRKCIFFFSSLSLSLCLIEFADDEYDDGLMVK